MKLKATTAFGLCGVAAACLAGCGSGGGARGDAGNTGDTGGGTPGGSGLTWQDDGANHTALFASASRVISSTLDMLQIAGGEAAVGIAFGVSMPPPLVPGTHTCSQVGVGGVIVSISYNRPGVGPLASSCTITIATIGATTGTHATGTFSAVFPLDAGGTKAITNGNFDLSQLVSTL